MLVSVDGPLISPPTAIDENLLSEDSHSHNSQPENTPSWLEVFCQKIQLVDILERLLISEDTNDQSSLRKMPNLHAIINLEAELSKWESSLPSSLQYDSSFADAGSGCPADRENALWTGTWRLRAL